MQKQLELNINDIVHLISGSPDLKIVAVRADRVEVERHNEQNYLGRAEFP
jgi:hypothetical protein